MVVVHDLVILLRVGISRQRMSDVARAGTDCAPDDGFDARSVRLRQTLELLAGVETEPWIDVAHDQHTAPRCVCSAATAAASIDRSPAWLLFSRRAGAVG